MLSLRVAGVVASDCQVEDGREIFASEEFDIDGNSLILGFFTETLQDCLFACHFEATEGDFPCSFFTYNKADPQGKRFCTLYRPSLSEIIADQASGSFDFGGGITDNPNFITVSVGCFGNGAKLPNV